ncbi:arginase family enzyme [Catenuloplanes nepalensis]|uniref:Arginase family enzyme n=1 Tax=Catenuloplanes nepalensis TaxID=587533 RepID=A0ABT9N1K7_9ACTN|nr:arginase family enzyme [Catenuloplanes nepalensis]
MRRIAVLDAPSNLGLRPPTETSVPGCAKAPGALRDAGLLHRLRARDAGCLTPPRYDPGDWRPGDGVCHAPAIGAYSVALADRIGTIIDNGEFPVILGGDCSVSLGSALAMRRLGQSVGGHVGLVFVDGHSDFRHPGNASYVGAAAGEGLALITGRGQADLTALEGRRPYYRDVDVVVVGIRANDEYRLDLQAAGIVTRPVPALRAEGAPRSAQWALDQIADCAGFWVHIDVDVLDPAVMPAVDAPEPGGIAFTELEALLEHLVGTPHCLGMEITVFDPDYDPDGSYAAEIVATVGAGIDAAGRLLAAPRPRGEGSAEPSGPVESVTAPSAAATGDRAGMETYEALVARGTGGFVGLGAPRGDDERPGDTDGFGHLGGDAPPGGADGIGGADGSGGSGGSGGFGGADGSGGVHGIDGIGGSGGARGSGGADRFGRADRFGGAGGFGGDGGIRDSGDAGPVVGPAAGSGSGAGDAIGSGPGAGDAIGAGPDAAGDVDPVARLRSRLTEDAGLAAGFGSLSSDDAVRPRDAGGAGTAGWPGDDADAPDAADDDDVPAVPNTIREALARREAQSRKSSPTSIAEAAALAKARFAAAAAAAAVKPEPEDPDLPLSVSGPAGGVIPAPLTIAGQHVDASRRAGGQRPGKPVKRADVPARRTGWDLDDLTSRSGLLSPRRPSAPGAADPDAPRPGGLRRRSPAEDVPTVEPASSTSLTNPDVVRPGGLRRPPKQGGSLRRPAPGDSAGGPDDSGDSEDPAPAAPLAVGSTASAAGAVPDPRSTDPAAAAGPAAGDVPALGRDAPDAGGAPTATGISGMAEAVGAPDETIHLGTGAGTGAEAATATEAAGVPESGDDTEASSDAEVRESGLDDEAALVEDADSAVEPESPAEADSGEERHPSAQTDSVAVAGLRSQVDSGVEAESPAEADSGEEPRPSADAADAAASGLPTETESPVKPESPAGDASGAEREPSANADSAAADAGLPAEAGAAVEVEPLAEADSAADAGPPAEAGAAVEVEPLAEADSAAETGRPAEADSVADPELPAEADSAVRSGTSAEIDPAQERQPLAVADSAAETGRPADADSAVEVEPSAEAVTPVESGDAEPVAENEPLSGGSGDSGDSGAAGAPVANRPDGTSPPTVLGRLRRLIGANPAQPGPMPPAGPGRLRRASPDSGDAG